MTTNSDVDRTTVRITEDIGETVGADGRDYMLSDGDIVTLPTTTAEPLLEKNAAEPIDGHPDTETTDRGEQVRFQGPPEPLVDEDGIRFVYPTDDHADLDTVDLGTWSCLRCGTPTNAGVADGELRDPTCKGCDRNGPFEHAGPDTITADTQQAALRAERMWHPPSTVTDDGFDELWDDVCDYLYDHWDAGKDDTADAVYAGLTAYALSTWVRPNLEFVPHLMLMGKTTGGKTRLLNTLARVSYRAMVAASATPASMFRLIDAYDVTYYISEYHGLHPDTSRQVDAVVRAGQKRDEVVTRAESTATGHEPKTFDPFSHVAIATQYEPDDDIVNRCIQVRSTTATRDMPATLDDQRARRLRNRLLYARFRLLESDEWQDAEQAAYKHLAREEITGRTREKLLGLLTIAYIWNHVPSFEPFIDEVVEQDRTAAADSEDALVVTAIRDLAFEAVTDVAVLGDADPFAAVEIPLSKIANRYEDMTGVEKSASWVGHVRSRLDLEKDRKRDGTVITDPELGPKLQALCEDLNLEWESLDTHDVVEELPEADQYQSTCSECGERPSTHRYLEEGYYVCEQCADAIRDYEG